jgi:hypothetical protein
MRIRCSPVQSIGRMFGSRTGQPTSRSRTDVCHQVLSVRCPLSSVCSRGTPGRIQQAGDSRLDPPPASVADRSPAPPPAGPNTGGATLVVAVRDGRADESNRCRKRCLKANRCGPANRLKPGVAAPIRLNPCMPRADAPADAPAATAATAATTIAILCTVTLLHFAARSTFATDVTHRCYAPRGSLAPSSLRPVEIGRRLALSWKGLQACRR